MKKTTKALIIAANSFLLALFCMLPAAAQDDGCEDVASTALKYAANTTCDLSIPQCRKFYHDKFLRECREAAYPKKSQEKAASDKTKTRINATIQAYNEEADHNLKAGRPDKAIASFTKALRLAPDNAELLYNRGMVHAQTGQTDLAISDLSKAIKLNPSVAGGNAYVIRGGELFKKRDFDGAIRDYTRVLALTPSDSRAYASRASAYAAQKEHRQAVADYSSAIKLEPSNPRFYAARSQSYRKLGKRAEALADEKTINMLTGE